MAKVIHIPMYMSYAQLEQAYKRSGVSSGALAFELHEHFMMVTVSYTSSKSMRALRRFMEVAGLLHAGRVWFGTSNMRIEFDENCWDANHHSDMSVEELQELSKYKS